MISRNRQNKHWFIQQFIVNEDDGLHDYLEEYKMVINQRERKRMIFHHRSTQLHHRRYLVDYLKIYVNKHYLSAYCLHLATYLLDIIMDRHFIKPYKLFLIANTCLLLAAKCEEIYYKTPTIKQLNFEAISSFTKLDYITTEISILELFNWYLLLPTAVHFVQFYMIRVIDQGDLKYNARNFKTLINQIKKIVSNCLYKVVDDFHYMHNFAPSRQAAAIIFAARSSVGLKGWSNQLQKFTGYSRLQLQDPVDVLFRNRNVYCNLCDRQNYNHVSRNE